MSTADPVSPAVEGESGPSQALKPVEVVYCGGESRRTRRVSLNADLRRLVCTFPVEYCEFGEHLTRCKEWLQKERPDLYEDYYSEGTS